MDGGDSGVEAIAKRLEMSPRSLQRRLSQEQIGYNDLLKEVREEFAERYLARGTLTASEVAYLIGFTEPPAFFKAFKALDGAHAARISRARLTRRVELAEQGYGLRVTTERVT